MKRVFIIIVILAQLAVLIGMAAQREWISRFGRRIYLRTIPVDPTDYMRGEYARLNYEISNVPRKHFRDGVIGWENESSSYRAHRDARVYALLDVDPDGLAHLVGLTDREPRSGVYLRGRITSFYHNAASVRYGIEALFMQEGKAANFEREARDRSNDAPIDAVIAVSPSGTAVIRTTQREALGLTAKIERGVRTVKEDGQPSKQEPITGATVTLTNRGTTPLTVVLRLDGKSFRLVATPSPAEDGDPWVNENTPLDPPSPADFKPLAPGESVSQHIDLENPYWAVVRPAQPQHKLPAQNVQLSDLSGIWGHSYHLEYTPGIQFSDAAQHVPPVSPRSISSAAFTTAK